MTTSDSTDVSPPRSVRQPHVELASTASLPTEFGDFRIHVFTSDGDHREQVAIIHGDVFGASAVPTRIHSECLTGDVLGSLRCDCRKQLELGLRQIATMSSGVVLYLRQEGRGIGLANKIRAYKLQEDGLDTVDANLALGFRDDERDYGVAAAMLRTLGVRSVRLMTNNPDKVVQLYRYGVPVVERLAHAIPRARTTAATSRPKRGGRGISSTTATARRPPTPASRRQGNVATRPWHKSAHDVAHKSRELRRACELLRGGPCSRCDPPVSLSWPCRPSAVARSATRRRRRPPAERARSRAPFRRRRRRRSSRTNVDVVPQG